MENKSMGQLIQSLRKEKGLTQKQLADMLNITDKAVSKWERGVACPDTATLPKLAEILEVRVESLLNAKIEAVPEENVLPDNADMNPHAEMYKERTKQHLLKGLPGFIIGSIGTLVLFIMYIIGNGPSYTSADVFGMFVGVPIVMVMVGLIFAGFPYGWQVVSKWTGRWVIYGNIIVVVCLFVLKLGVAWIIGAFAYPIVLVYNFIRSQKTKRKVKIWTIVAISVVGLWCAFIGGYSIIDAKLNSETNNNTETTAIQAVDAETFRGQSAFLDVLCKNALDVTREQEKEIIDAYGWKVTEPSKLHGVYFFEAKDPENPHYNFLETFNLSNAVVVITGYFLQDADMVINQWEMDVTLYPNFIFDEGDALTYNEEKVYSHSLRADDMDDLVEWLSSEYSDMSITEITSG